MRAMPTSGEQLGPYHLSIALGFTDRSAVFSANHTGSGREVTVAVMLPDHADDLEAVQQFFREARSLKVLSHENLVEVVDILEEPQPFFAVEAMRGQLLSEMTKPAKLPLAAALHIAWQVCQGLRAAHESGEIHRALRPGSIFVLDRADEWGTVKILGFSTVSPMAIESAWPSIAPEQWRGEFVDHRTDIYSYGALLYELTTGRRPITGTTIGEFRHGHERSSVVPPSTFQPMMPQALDMLIEKCLAKDHAKPHISEVSSLGLVEMTRKRTRESLAHMLCQPCPTCEGRAQVKTPRSVCYDILREILREARQFNPREFRVVASAAVVEMMLDEESVHLAGLSEFIGKPISLSAEPGMNPEQYDIVLM